MIVNNSDSVRNSETEVEIRAEPFTEVFEVHSELGRGKYAVVKRVVRRSSGVSYAAKFLHKRRRGRDCRADALHEVRMLRRTGNHPRVVQLIELYENSHDFILITELVSGGELFQHIESEGRIDESVAVRLLRQVLEGVHFLHSLNIIHLDIKPQNILLTGSPVDCDVKLCDFGLSRPFSARDEVLEIAGTLDFVAPEVLDYVSLDSACDMWSIGVLAYVMLTGCSPFAGNSKQETLLNISQVNLDFPEELFTSVSDDAVDFIRRLLAKNTSERMSAAECLDHAWLRNRDVEVSTNRQSQTPAESPSLPRCRVLTTVESPSGQRRTLTSTLTSDEHKPVKKCRCDGDVESLSVPPQPQSPCHRPTVDKENRAVDLKGESTSKVEVLVSAGSTPCDTTDTTCVVSAC